MELDEKSLARRFAALPPQARRSFLAKLREAGLSFTELPIVPADRNDPIPVSHAQRSLWLTWQLDPASPAYNMPGLLRLNGTLRTGALLVALRSLVERHETLRTVFRVTENGEPVQVILPVDAVRPEVVDLRSQASPADGDELHRLQHAFARMPFGLDAEPPVRFTLWQVGESEHVLGIVLHHISGDGASVGILIDELLNLYQDECVPQLKGMEPLPVQFSDYVVWQRNWFETGEMDRQLAYWQTRLGSEHPPLELPFDRLRGTVNDSVEGRYGFSLSAELSKTLRILARANSASLFMVMLALFKLMLCRLSGQGDIRVGAPIANRQRAETRGMLAYLTNVLVLRTEVDTCSSFVDLLARVRETVLDAHAHPDVPFDLLVESLQPERQAGVHPLFQVKCTQQDDVPLLRNLPGLEVRVEVMSAGSAHFDLSLDFTDRADRIDLVLSYATSLFDAGTIAGFSATFQDFAAQVTAQPYAPLVAELQGPLSERIGSAVIFPHADVLDGWDLAVAGDPRRTAVRDEAMTMTYGEVDAKANQLAAHLVSRGVGAETRVGLHADRSCAFVLGVLAVLKAGGAYVPLDPRLPVDRLAFQLGDSGARWLLSDQEAPWSVGIPVIPLSANGAAAADGSENTEHVAPLRRPVHPEQTAYLIYTSGSTGRPKGVAVGRGALANYVQAVLARLDLPDSARNIAMVSTVAADLGHTSFFGALCSGRTLHLVDADRAFDPDRFALYMAAQRVDVLKIVPGHLQALLQAGRPADVLPTHALIVGGEATHWPLLTRIQDLKPLCRVFNHYGPTETTVGALVQPASNALRAATLPLGHPLANLQAMALDAGLNLVPPGMTGELYLGGAGVARGYERRPGLTAERFVAHPRLPGERLYRTGDRVRLLSDGSLEFLGRLDDQVKIRGYRVELGEVRAALLARDGVREAGVIALPAEDGRSVLHAYLAARGDCTIDPTRLKSELEVHLPDYMVPATITVLGALPLTPNGKLDRKALPAPQLPKSKAYEAPVGEAEEILARVWADVLRADLVGRNDNFFELGGDSILSLQIIARARKKGLKITPKQLMEQQTIARIAGTLPAAVASAILASSAAAQEPDVAAASQEVPLTPVQRWFFAQEIRQRNHWNQSVLLVPDVGLQSDQLRGAMQAMAARHDALRLRYSWHEGGWRQTLSTRPDEGWRLTCTDLRDAPDFALAVEQAADQAQRSLDLTNGPLLHAVLMDGGVHGQRLLLIGHHLVVDAVTWRVLVDDLRQFCTLGDHEDDLPASSPFSLWAERLEAYARSDALRQELDFWLADSRAEDSWPVHGPDAANTAGSMRGITVRLAPDRTEALLKKATRPYRNRVDELLLGALSRVMCEWTGHDSVRIELESHGREDLFDDVDLSRTAGWFTALYPVRLTPQADLRGTLLAVKETLRAVPQRGIGYGLLRFLREEAALEPPQPRLTFNYLGHVDRKDGPGWRLAKEPRGVESAEDSPRRAWFEVISRVEQGELVIDWNYSAALHRTEEVQGLVDRFAAELNAIVAHGEAVVLGALSPSDVPLSGLSQNEIDALCLDPANVEDIYPLAPMQQGLLLHTLINAGAGMYLMQDQYHIDAAIDADAFERAWNDVVQRHEALRTGFMWQAGKTPLQIVYRSVPSPVQTLDWSGLEKSEAERKLDEMLRLELAEGFDFSRPPLMRLRLIQLADGVCHLVQSFHHILMDAWCRSLLLTDFFARYEAYTGTRPVDAGFLRPRPRRYRDFVGWLGRQNSGDAREYWRAQLAGFDTVTPLPWRNALIQSEALSAVVDVTTWIDASGTAALQRSASQRQVTVNTVVQAAWALTLARLGQVDDVLFGVTVAGRPLELEGIQETVGLFINTIPMRVRMPDGNVPVHTWLQTLLSQNLAMRQHEHMSLAEIQALGDMRGGRALFDCLFVFENAPLEASLLTDAARLGFRPTSNRTHTNYPLTVVVVPGQQLMLQLTCDSRQFTKDGARRLLACFSHALRELSDHADDALHTVGVVPDAMTRAMLGRTSGDSVAYPFASGYAALFEAQAVRHADRIAVSCLDQRISYRDLNRRANRIGHLLRANGVAFDAVVALCAERGIGLHEMIIGTLKAGAAYLALDMKLPPQRMARMLESSGAKVLLLAAEYAEDLQPMLDLLPPSVRVIVSGAAESGKWPSYDLGIEPNPDGAAYVIYTSGSTGEPKGVVVTQRGMLNNQLSKIPFLSLTEHDVIAQTASPSFDISVWQTLAGLLCGACVDIVPDKIARDPAALPGHVASRGITVLQSVPALMRAMLDAPYIEVPSLRWMLPTGEASTAELARQWFGRYPSIPLVNAYGPAECADDVSLQRLDVLEDDAGHFLPVGRPTDNTRLLVLDRDLAALPAGVAGELYVAGVGVGRGYLGRPGLTAERFVPHPAPKVPGERLYRTGDLARYRDDGVLECFGRTDQQVKIRGLRIELGEIEAQIGQLGNIREAAVHVHEDAKQSRHLVAYVVLREIFVEPLADRNGSSWKEPLVQSLRAVLPDYMVPALWVQLERLPLTLNGKLDRKALQAPDFGLGQEDRVPPQGDCEAQVAAVWAEVLGVELVGRNDHFFEIGGHSLSAMQVATRLRASLHVPIPIDTLFRTPVLHEFAALIEAEGGNTDSLRSLDTFIDTLAAA
ncbi:amino acid adenylation domain-containing protein [Achromobacter sp. SD115]|uniref:non-ribosomal peptide synthetase n=1 Tax=Achromobacter sp. SD115 TaxID=2782011 RepID=UPI001A961D56|nr:non-ribosomal peptide synthetase [Achromobacter sp. SD115]MBO1013728.1 amino acid adenylation domain-containing protein [Achromobacter sp. SD115]